MAEPTLSTSADLELATSLLRERQASFVLVAQGQVLEVGAGHGVLPLLRAVDRIGPAALAGAALADKMVGRAVALVAVHVRLAAVHGEFMSRAAVETLQRAGIPFTLGIEIPAVLNRSGSHLCPFEELVAEAPSPAEAVERLRMAAEKGIRGAAQEILGRLPDSLREWPPRAGGPPSP